MGAIVEPAAPEGTADVSARALNRVLAMAFPPEQTGTKFVLGILAWRYKEDEGHAFPTVGELAWMASVSERQIHRALAWLVDHGLLEIEQRRRANGTRTASSYTLPWFEAAEPQTAAHGTRTARPPDAHGRWLTPPNPPQTDAHVTQPPDAHVSLSQVSHLTHTSPLSRNSSRELPTRQPPRDLAALGAGASSSASLNDEGPPDDQHAVSAAAPDGAPAAALPPALDAKIIDLAERKAMTAAPPDVEAMKRRALAMAELYRTDPEAARELARRQREGA